MNEILELKQKIAKLEAGLKSKNMPESQKKIFEKALENATTKLKDLESAPPKKIETRGRKKGIPNKTKQEKKSTDEHSKKPINEKKFNKLLDKLKSKKAYSFLKKIKKANLIKDYGLSALPSGKRTSANGNIYYEYRPNRTDVSAIHRLAHGGGLDTKRKDYYYARWTGKGKWSDEKQVKIPNSTWAEAVTIVKHIAQINKTEVRLSESEGYSNQGHYFHWQQL